MIYPLLFNSIKREHVWGSESWKLCDRQEGRSLVVNGVYKGSSLQHLMALWKEKFLGKGRSFLEFPLLIKIIHAQETLSLQVHPTEKTASIFKGEPKNESWIMLEQGEVYLGFKKGVTKKIALKSLRENTLPYYVELIQVQKGDSIYVPAGQIHAIGAGSSLLEVQQNSNTTYRLYDWGRNNRPLHLKEGLACIDWKQKKTPQLISQLLEENIAYQRELLVNSPNFIIERVKVRSRWNPPLDETTFQMFFCQSGSCKVMCNHHIECLPLSAICLIPASAQSLNIEGVCELIWIRLS